MKKFFMGLVLALSCFTSQAALVWSDKVMETTTTTGTGALTLGGAVSGYVSFGTAIGNSNTCYYGVKSASGTEWETGFGTLNGSSTTLTRTTVHFSSNANAAVNFSAGTKYIFVDITAKAITQMMTGADLTNGQLIVGSTGASPVAATLTAGQDVTITNAAGSITVANTYTDPLMLQNVGLSVSIGSSATTIALKQADGSTNPSSTAPCRIGFSSSTLTDGSSTTRTVSSALSVVVSNGSSLGFASTSATQRVWIGAIDNSGTVELCVWTSLSGTNLKRFYDGQIVTTTAEGGAGAADTAQTIYSTTARTSKALRVLGYYEIQAAGSYAWTNSPTVVRVVHPGMPRTGDVIQRVRTNFPSVTTGTTTTPNDNTIPQNTEGNEFMTQAITPTATSNVLSVVAQGWYSHGGAAVYITQALFQDSTADALTAAITTTAGATYANPINTDFKLVAGTTSSTTLKIRTGSQTSAGGTLTFNGVSGAQYFNGVSNSYLEITELSQ